MSGEAVGWAFRKVQMDDPTAKFVLVALCNYADANDKAWPSHDDLVRVTGLSKRAVQNNLKKLVDWGIITRVREFRGNGSENNPSVYLDLESRPVVVDGVASGATPTSHEVPPDMARGATLQTTDTKPQKNLRPAKQQDAPYSEEFENEVWKPYPRKAGTSKKKAWDMFRMQTPGQQQQIKIAIPLYAAMMKREGRPEDKIKHLQFWISERVYETIGTPAGAAAPAEDVPFWKRATREQWGKVLEMWRERKIWSEAWGPEPDQSSCRVPADLLAAHNLKYRSHLFRQADLDRFEKLVGSQNVAGQPPRPAAV